ncbi:hypothetical protein C0058_06395 [Pseudomonas sp. NC02]|nr:hypothetical protein C0058_06395 [Pseudomonas sp. NC02]
MCPLVPTLCVGMPLVTLCVTLWDAERPGLLSHTERGNEQSHDVIPCTKKCGSPPMWEPGLPAIASPRSISCTEVMLSQASQLPHKPAPTFHPASFIETTTHSTSHSSRGSRASA